MQIDERSIPEEILGLAYHYLPPQRQAEVSAVLQALQEDAHLEFLLTVLDVTVNDRPLNPATPPSRSLLKKLLQALDAESGEYMLYHSPYNQLGLGERAQNEHRIEWWDFDIGEYLYRFPDLRSVLAFLEHGSGNAPGRAAAEAQALHDRLLTALIGRDGSPGEIANFGIWSCLDVRTPGASRPPLETPEIEERLWPAEDVSPWFHGVFWDDLLLLLNPPESTLTVLALTSQ